MPEVDYNALRFALDLLQLLGLAAIGVYTWLINRSKANRAAIGELERQATSHAERLAIIEQQIAQAPTHTDLGKVYDRLNGVAETLSQLNGQLNGVTHQLSMVNEYLLNQGAKKSSYERYIAEDQRRIILATLEGDPAYSHNEQILRASLEHWGHTVSRDALRTELNWLAEQGLVTLAGETVWTARLTARGEDTALGRTRVPGVARPPLE